MKLEEIVEQLKKLAEELEKAAVEEAKSDESTDEAVESVNRYDVDIVVSGKEWFFSKYVMTVAVRCSRDLLERVRRSIESIQETRPDLIVDMLFDLLQCRREKLFKVKDFWIYKVALKDNVGDYILFEVCILADEDLGYTDVERLLADKIVSSLKNSFDVDSVESSDEIPIELEDQIGSCERRFVKLKQR